MTKHHSQHGFTLVELLVSLVVLVLAMSSVAGVLVQNAQINKSEQMSAEVQATARVCMELVLQRLRNAGWDPSNSGTVPTVALDSDLTDDVSYIEIFADLVPDGVLDDPDEAVLIRHTNNILDWRTSAAGAFVPLAVDISNDADGDGTAEPMFVPDANPPSMITVQITAQSPVPDPRTGDFIRYTVRSEVTLRKTL